MHSDPERLGVSKRVLVLNVSIGLLGVVAIFFRLWDLSWVPGLNADEAWYGLAARQLLRGESFGFQTPSHNWANPFFILPHIVLAEFFAPHFILLRAVPVAYGVLTIWLVFWLTQKWFGRQAGLLCALSAACLPIHIAYARFNWDPAMSFGVGYSLIVCCLLNGPTGILLPVGLFLGALLVHPTNIFLLPAACMISISAKGRTVRERCLLCAFLVLVGVGFFALSPAMQLHRSFIGPNFHRFVESREALAFFKDLGRFFWGFQIEAAVAGPVAPGWLVACDWILTPILLLALMASCVGYRRDTLRLSVAIAALVTILVTFVTVGDGVLTPDSERYAMFLLPPLFLWIASWSQTRWAPWVVLPLCVFCLASFYRNYFVPLQTFGGASQLSFRTADPEPKYQVFQRILALRPNGPVVIYAENMWIAHPLAYLADSSRFDVESLDSVPKSFSEIKALIDQCAVFVTENDSSVSQFLKALNGTQIADQIRDPANKILFEIQTCQQSTETK
jgi:4-amino-4-deoxy-L-arabinose transferase-like glycosyltransferase